jgi:hypothetical protein
MKKITLKLFVRRNIIPAVIILFSLTACGIMSSTPSPAPQASLTAGQATTTIAPGKGTSASSTLDPCKLITTEEVTTLLGSSPPPTTGIHDSTAAHYCFFQAKTGILEIAIISSSNPTTEFSSAVAAFQSAPNYKKVTFQGATIAFSGGPATNGTKTQGMVAAIIKGSTLVSFKLDSTIFIFNADKATILMETIAGRLP